MLVIYKLDDIVELLPCGPLSFMFGFEGRSAQGRVVRSHRDIEPITLGARISSRIVILGHSIGVEGR